MNEDDGFIRITLRLPVGLHAKLTDAAARKRSMNAEIIDRLEDSFLTDQLGVVAAESSLKPPTAKELKRLAEIIVILERNALNEDAEDKLDADYEKARRKPRVKKPDSTP